MVYKKFNNSIFIINIVTVFYLFIFEIINPVKKHMAYPYKLLRLFILSVKKASIIIFNLFLPPNLNLNIRIRNK